MTVAPTAVVPGSTNNTFTFTYVPGSHRLKDGKVKVAIPTVGRIQGRPGFVATNRGTLSVLGSSSW